MARLYSVPFILVQGLGGVGEPVTVPAGHTYIVKQLTVYSDPLLGAVYCRFKSVDADATLFAASANIATPTWSGFYGAICFSEGASFLFEVSTAFDDAADVYAGGYDLLNVT